MAKNKWIITTGGDRSLADISKHLTEQGFEVEQQMHEIKCITGSASEEVAKRVRNIPGVVDVSKDGDINIGNPGEDITW